MLSWFGNPYHDHLDVNALANSCVEIFTQEKIGTMQLLVLCSPLDTIQLPPLSPTLFLSPGFHHYKTCDDFCSLDDYAHYVKNNIAVGLMVRCCESYRKVHLGDIGRVTKVSQGDISRVTKVYY